MIQKNQDTPIYEANGDATTDFLVNILEDGLYTVALTGNNAKGQVTFCKEKQ